ncbi:unnamed protein product [Caretta caretta]
MTLCTYFCNVNTSSQVPGRSPSLPGAQWPGPSISKISGVYNEVVSLLAHMDDQDKGKIALRIAFIAETKLAIVLTVLLEKLQKDEQSRVDIYCALEKVLQQDTQGLERRLLEKIITLASNHVRETQEATNELKVAASNTLVTLARCYFNDVMCELLYRLELPEEFIFITLGNLSSAYDSRKMLKGCKWIFYELGKCPFSRMGESQFCNTILPLYCHVTSNWPICEELESLSQLLEVSGEYKIPLPKGKFQAICSALHNQICSPAKQLSIENHQELFHCVLLLARSSPDDLLAFLHEQLEIEHEAVPVASLDLLRAIVGADLSETRVKKLLIVKAAKSTLSDQNATVRKAALHFIRTLLSSGRVENSAAWDLVAYVFSEFSVSTSKLGTTLLTQDVQEESTVQTLCIDILQCLDTSVNGMTQVSWHYEMNRVQLPTPQGLLARLLVVASSPYEREGHGCAALRLLKALHQTIHAAVGEMWGVEIPSLLQYIEGRYESIDVHVKTLQSAQAASTRRRYASRAAVT